MKFVIFLVFCFVKCSYQQKKQPNVVVIMADDLGFNDVSFRGSDEIPTPNIDALAYNGAILNRFYTPWLCTPSRASLMTGKYPHRTGMQHWVIQSSEAWALGKDQKLLPQYFRDAGYKTRLIGKWHLGFYQQQYAPTNRGFDSFFGYLGPYIDYFDYTMKDFQYDYTRGYDMRRNLTVAKDFDPIYATNLFTKEAVNVISKHDKKSPLYLQLNHIAPHTGNQDFPMQAPDDVIAKFSNIPSLKRRTLAAMISILDDGVGCVVKALYDNKMLDNTIIVFYSDNGGPTVGIHSTNASNYPLRGQKQSGWDGGTRTNAVFYSPFLNFPGVVRNQLMHVSDLFPTLLKLAGLRTSPSNIDGVDQWPTINNGGQAARSEVANIDDVMRYGSYISFNYKLVSGSSSAGAYDNWLTSDNKKENIQPVNYAVNVLSSTVSRAILSVQKKNRLTIDKIHTLREAATVTCTPKPQENACDLTKDPCLFDIIADPCERNNLASSRRLIFEAMKEKYERIRKSVVPTRRKPDDPACDPSHFDNNWNWWQADS